MINLLTQITYQILFDYQQSTDVMCKLYIQKYIFRELTNVQIIIIYKIKQIVCVFPFTP